MNRFSSSLARYASRILRCAEITGSSRRTSTVLRTYCMVIVEAPCAACPRHEVRKTGANDADRVHAAVLVEALVLDGDDAVDEVRRDPRQRHDLAVLEIEVREELAVGGVDLGRLGHREGAGLVDVGKALEPVVDDGEGGRCRCATTRIPDHDDGDDGDAQSDDARRRAAAVLALRRRSRLDCHRVSFVRDPRPALAGRAVLRSEQLSSPII